MAAQAATHETIFTGNLRVGAMARADEPIADDELEGLFGHLAGRPLALAVSGGADSMALMHLVARWAARSSVMAAWSERSGRSFEWDGLSSLTPPQIDRRGLARPVWLMSVETLADLKSISLPQIVVLTVDHGLRPESAGEARLVFDEARRLGLPCQILRWDGEKPASGVQEAARQVRRDLMLDVLRAEAGQLRELTSDQRLRLRWDAVDRVLVTAHHQEDQAETFLMRLARGSGLDGLSAMRRHSVVVREPAPERPSSYAAHVDRPFLALPKSRLIATLRAGGHIWIEDPSNADERFERVRIRRFLSQAEQFGLSAEKIALSARRLGDAEMSLRLLKNEPATVPTVEISTGLYAQTPALRLGWSEYLAARTLRQLIRWYGGAAREPGLSQLEQLARLLRDDKARRECGGLTLGGCKIELLGDKHERIRLYREGAGANIAPVALDPGRSLDWDGGRFSIWADSHAEAGARVEALGMARWAKLKNELPALEALRWPAAAAATLPVIMRAQAIVAYPALPALVNRTAPNEQALHAAWRAFDASCEQEFQALFRNAPDW